MTYSVMKRQIKMQVYHRRYYTCSAAWSSWSSCLCLPFLPQQLHLGITLRMQSNCSQVSSETATDRLLRAASGQGNTHSTVTNGTGHCHFSLLTKGHLLVTRLQRSQSTSTAAQGCYFSEEVFTFVWVKLKELSTCAFPYLAEVLLGGRPTLQLPRVPSNHCLLYFISFIYYKGVQRHVNQLAKKEYSWYMCYGIR